MGRFLIVTWDGGGNVFPALGLARVLLRRRHDVRILGPSSLEARITATGARFRCFERLPRLDPASGRSIEDQIALWFGFWGGLAAGQELHAELDREPADAVAVDCMLGGALVAAEARGVPTAVIEHMLYQPAVEGSTKRMWDGLLPLVNETRRRFGLAELDPSRGLWEQQWGRARLVLVAAPAALDHPMAHRSANVRYVGPIFDDDAAGAWDLPWGPEDPTPLVLVSFSTTYQHQEQPLARVLDALAGLPVCGLLTAGTEIDPDELRVPSNVVVRRWMPHALVLPRAAAVVTHAGLWTVMAALAQGVPLLCMPMGRDQHANAERVEAIGAGRALAADASAAEVRAALEDVLGSPVFRQGAGRMAGLIAQEPGIEGAVAQLETLLGSG